MQLHHRGQHQPSNPAIATSVIALGPPVDLNVTAEGVETKEDLEFLKSRDCDEYQGFFCSRPVPVDELKLLLVAYHPIRRTTGQSRPSRTRRDARTTHAHHLPHKI